MMLRIIPRRIPLSTCMWFLFMASVITFYLPRDYGQTFTTENMFGQIQTDDDVMKRLRKERSTELHRNHKHIFDIQKEQVVALQNIKDDKRNCYTFAQNLSITDLAIDEDYWETHQVNLTHLRHSKPVFIAMNNYGYPQRFENQHVNGRATEDYSKQQYFREDWRNTSMSYHYKRAERKCKNLYKNQTFTVFHDVLESSYITKPNDVTVLTILSVNKIDRLERLINSWPGPASVVIYIYKRCINTFFDDFMKLEISKRKDLLLHLAIPHLYLEEEMKFFPINIMRNIALRGARSDYVFYVDVDFVPNLNAYDNIQKWLVTASVNNKIGYILPAFDVRSTDDISKNKTVINHLIQRQEITLFQERTFPACHRSTYINKWMNTNESYEVFYKFPFEPYCVFPRLILPAYPEITEGRVWDKITQAKVLDLLGWRFKMLPDVYIMHIDHPRPPDSDLSGDLYVCAKETCGFMAAYINKENNNIYSVFKHKPFLKNYYDP